MGFFATILPLIILGILDVVLVAHMILFGKADRHQWAVVVPFYGSYTFYDIAWKGSVYFAELALTILASIVAAIAKNAPQLATVMLIIQVIIVIALIAIRVVFCYKLSKVFEHGVEFALGLLFLYPIFICILAFGESRYKYSGSTEYTSPLDTIE